ncbi:MAG: GmrSD restriction endonuclease domain-containing protein [Bacillota bacterium]
MKTLFDDLVEFTKNSSESTYFLGTIVSFQNENNEQEIIDGQQRITSLFLLLHALYSKLDSMVQIKEVENFKRQIELALWKQDEFTAEVNFKKPLFNLGNRTHSSSKMAIDLFPN